MKLARGFGYACSEFPEKSRALFTNKLTVIGIVTPALIRTHNNNHRIGLNPNFLLNLEKIPKFSFPILGHVR